MQYSVQNKVVLIAVKAVTVPGEGDMVGPPEHKVHLPQGPIARSPHGVQHVKDTESQRFHVLGETGEPAAGLANLEVVDLRDDDFGPLKGLHCSLQNG